ncbi:unnamed protein product [Adineta steineri]|uniref:G-protein coupled receptors family 1 profile domain-containing protein n=1 Tax=Adineta steineri TaxID=433720 RepID=A0A819XTZ9_9BILA|nr:unnamed protein product [Adineta steineri]CAF4140435.1 unnamed protein product [Adineta steineri]
MTNYNLGLCKIENFSFYLARSTSCWFIALACFDRFCHSSASAAIRRMSSIKIARWTVVITSVTITLLYSHMVIYYEITNVSDRFGNITPLCNGRSGIYRTFLGFWYMALYSLCPSFFMLLFGFLTLNNIRQRRQVVPTVAGTNQLVRRTDNQLLRMLIAQMLVIIISTLPFSVYQLYAAFTSNFSKSTLQLAQENLAARVVGVMTYFAHTTSFYLYTLTGTVFRKELRRIIGQCWN